MTMSEPLEVFICLDHLGDYAVGKDAESAKAAYEDQIQALSEAEGFRIMSIAVIMPLPEPIEACIDVPAAEETVSVVVK